MAKYDPDKIYTLAEASSVLKEITFAKFDSSVDVDIRLGIDPKKSDQMVRGVVSLPHGWGHKKGGVKMKIAEEHSGVSINDITDEKYFDKLSGIASFTGLPVNVRPFT